MDSSNFFILFQVARVPRFTIRVVLEKVVPKIDTVVAILYQNKIMSI